MAEETGERSEFNMAVAMLRRIDSILTECAVESSLIHLSRWFHLLQSLRRECNYLFSKEQDEKGNEILDILFGYENMQLERVNSTNLSDIEKKELSQNIGNYYAVLENYERFVRGILHSKDMLIVRKEDLKKAMLE